ncbi:S4 domain-containing protein YaaA [Salinibacillus xinjiangensis]|uniref:S4 domain-containing protein YaaA n=1 Tax=Salinibacillus xinjiangensis TaxID=1229268 RepID=A0A6G1XAY6_9BACI|nr:S4 domain-containing protein YaaA [Salinibacillus xinjiangensis]MRG87948.1 S4 domain-containing protein YaaA [Salinibacillus xinjiangensis]
MSEPIEISTDTIALGQFLKLANVIESGGMAKWFLQEFDVFVNDELEDRRGKKLKIGDVVKVEGIGSFEVVEDE